MEPIEHESTNFEGTFCCWGFGDCYNSLPEKFEVSCANNTRAIHQKRIENISS